MNEDTFWKVFAGVGAALVCALAVAWCVEACGGVPSAAQQAALAEDSLEQKACVDRVEAGIGKADMKFAIDQCRDEVKLRRDGGMK